MGRTRVISASVALIAVAILTPASAAAERFKFQYAAKFVCGFDPPGAFVRVTPGQYATSVLIHNPQRKAVKIRKKVALTFPPDTQDPGEVSDFITDTLGSDEALQVDCEEIGGHPPVSPMFPLSQSEFFPGRDLFAGQPGSLGGFPPYIQGFVIIESTHSVDVAAIVSVGDLGEGPPGVVPGNPRSLDVEYVPERRLGDNDDDD